MPLSAGVRLGPYEIVARLGSGGMGEVYRAHDSRLGRDVAIKVLPAEVSADPVRRQRFEREARAIAAINHPHICALHDLGHHDGTDFLVMELLEGESLEARLSSGPLPPDEAMQVGLTIVDALGALHERGLVHRDLKPANIFLSRHGVKLLDFGLARPSRSIDPADGRSMTQAGALVGTPQYMAPEQVRGGTVDERTDLFAAASVIYEMLAGRVAFQGDSVVDVLQAVAYGEPPPLPAGVASEALESALRRALAKDPNARPASAGEFAAALRGTLETPAGTAAVERRRAPIRVIVMPLRVLRPDPETDFLAFSLADAVSASLAGLDGIIVRSSLTAARYAGGAPDLRALAGEAAVDVALTGSIIRVGSQVRIAAQLVEVPQGSLAWSHTIQAPVQDLFQLQDALTNAIVSSLEVPLTARDHGVLRRDVPTSAHAYELYLRGNKLMMESSRWKDVRALYEEAVQLDPGYAPAWARLGRVLRVMAKYGGAESDADRARAERAFERALALNPDLAIAHHYYAYLEAELGRAPDAMVRLLSRARARRSDPELFAGLVPTCRYAGLLDASVAAHESARRLDPSVSTSVAYTHFWRGEYAAAIETDNGDPPFATILARYRLGARDEAIAALRRIAATSAHSAWQVIATTYCAAMEGNQDDLVRQVPELRATSFRDPEGFFLLGSVASRGGAHAVALDVLETAIGGGFHCPSALDDSAWDACRDDAAFVRLRSQAEAGHRRAREAYIKVDGPAVLGVTQ